MKEQSLSNKVAVISGSSMGIGKAIACELASLGAKVVLNGREKEKLKRTEKELEEKGYTVSSCRADIRFKDQCEQLISHAISTFGQLDILVNNAAVTSRGSVKNMETSNLNILMNTNFLGGAYLSKFAIPALEKTKGSIIFINRAAGFIGFPYNSAYCASN